MTYLPKYRQIGMSVHDSFEWTNAAIGGFGLLLTVATLFLAKGARTAARETREAIWQRDASDAFLDLSRMALSVLEYVELEQLPEAAVRVRDVLERLPRNRARFERFLGVDSTKLQALEFRYQQLASQLSAGAWDDREHRRTVRDAARTASSELSAICGRLMSAQDKEER